MRYASGHKAATRVRILSEAARLFRREGYRGTSVQRVMRSAGLTVGGFYAHFQSKQALLGFALRRVLAERRASLLDGLEGLAGRAWLEAVAGRYLSRSHRDTPDTGCALPSLSAELARGPRALRALLSSELNLLLAEMAAQLGPLGSLSARERAMGVLATCVGGLSLARATRGTPLSEELLHAARASTSR
jgi:TetR/AcrR family transcriptional regulator, transcriptional repressor for nem operon